MKYHFAFPNVGLLCGNCAYVMSPDFEKSFDKDGKWKCVVYCTNPKCRHCKLRYEVPPSAGFRLKALDAPVENIFIRIAGFFVRKLRGE